LPRIFLSLNPASKAKSVAFTPEGLARARELFETMFTKQA
jgi:hypothetical protein